MKSTAVPGHPARLRHCLCPRPPQQQDREDRSHLASCLPKLLSSMTMPRFPTPRLLKQASNNIFVINNQVKENTLQEVLAVTSRYGYLCPELQGNWQLLSRVRNRAEEESSSPQSGSRPAPPGKPPPSGERAADPPGCARSAPLGQGFPTRTAASQPRKAGGRTREGGEARGWLALPAPGPGGRRGAAES